MHTQPGPKRLVLKLDEIEKYAQERGWTSLRKQARALRLEHSVVSRAMTATAIRNHRYLPQLLADAVATGYSPTLGAAFERFVQLRDDQPQQDAA